MCRQTERVAGDLRGKVSEHDFGLGDIGMAAASGALAPGKQRHYRARTDPCADMVRIDRYRIRKALVVVGIAPHRGEPCGGAHQRAIAHALRPRSGAAERAGFNRDQARVDLREFVVTKAQRFQRAGFEVGEHDVRVRHHAAQQGLAFLGFQVEPEAALVAVPRAEAARQADLEPGLARAVGEGGRFDLHHIRAQIGEQAPCLRADDDHAEVEDFQAFKRSG